MVQTSHSSFLKYVLKFAVNLTSANIGLVTKLLLVLQLVDIIILGAKIWRCKFESNRLENKVYRYKNKVLKKALSRQEM